MLSTWTQPCRASMYVYTSHIVFLSDLLLKKSSDSPDPEDVLWERLNPNLDAFRTIIPTTLDIPASPMSHSNRAHMPAHSPGRPPGRRQSHSSCPTYSQNRGRGRYDGQHPWYVRSPSAFFSSDPGLPSRHLDPCPTRPPVLQHA